MNTFSLPYPHRFYCGMTGTGKTTKFLRDFQASPHGGIHFNYNRDPSPFPTVDGSYELSDILHAVRDGEKLNYLPSLGLVRARKEIAYVCHAFFDYNRGKDKWNEAHPFVMAFDEGHLIVKEGSAFGTIQQVFTSGRSFGFRGCIITPSPAEVDKICVKMAEVHTLFSLSDYEMRYFQEKRMPFEQQQGMVRSPDPRIKSHKYCIWVNGVLEGPFEEKI